MVNVLSISKKNLCKLSFVTDLRKEIKIDQDKVTLVNLKSD